MWAVISVAIVFILIIGFILGRLRPKVCARAVRRVFRGLPKPKSTYQVPRETALTYLIEIEKQELEIRQNGFKHVATINLGALALSGGLLASSKATLMFHLFAALCYILALIFTLFAIWLVADQRRKRLDEVLKCVSRNTGNSVELSHRRIASPTSSRVLVMVVYILFAMGALHTLTSFTIPKQCEWPGQKDRIERYACELVEISKFITDDGKDKERK